MHDLYTLTVFQFHKVRLKAVTIDSHLLVAMFQFHKVRLKGTILASSAFILSGFNSIRYD